MPRLEAYEQQVTAQPVNAGSVPIESFTGGWKTATETFDVLDETVKQFKKVQDFNQESDATLGMMQEVDAIKQEAANERDPAKLAEYKAKIDSAIGNNANKITDGLLKTQVQQKLALSGYKAFGDIRSDFRAKEIDLGQAKYMTLMDKYSRAYSEASDDVSRKVIRQSMSDMMDASVRSGLFDAADITKLKIANEKELDETDLAYDIQNLPDQVAARRKQGAYSSLTDAEVNKGIQAANSMKEQIRKQNEYIQKEAQISNEVNLMSSAVSGSPASIDDVRRMIASEEIRQDVGVAYIEFATSPYKVDSTTDSGALASTLDEIFKSGNKEQIATVIKNTLKGGTDGKISQDDLSLLIAVANSKNESLLSVNTDKKKQGSMWDVFANMNKSLKDWTESAQLPKNKSDDVMRDFAVELSKAKTQEDMNVALNKVTTKAKAENNPNFIKYKKDESYSFPSGKAICIGHDDFGNPLFKKVK
jgi:hypothetical protein